MNKTIDINIWDDFYDDGYVPYGETTESFIHVEDYDIPIDQTKVYLEYLLEYINENLNTDGIKLWLSLYEPKKKYPNLVGSEYDSILFNRWEIRLEGISHKQLRYWIEVFDRTELKLDNSLFRIYSES